MVLLRIEKRKYYSKILFLFSENCYIYYYGTQPLAKGFHWQAWLPMKYKDRPGGHYTLNVKGI